MVFIRTLAIGIAVWALSATPALAAQPRSESLTEPSSRLGAPAFSSDGHAQKSSASSTTTTTSAEPEAPVPVATSDTPPPGRYSSPNRILRIADRLPKMRAVRAEYRGSFGDVYLKGPSRWQVSYFSKQGKEIGLVILADYSGHVLEQWTGFQIAWTMARGYPGAFGRHVNALYIWIPMCFLFFVPFFDWRKPWRLLHLDLLVLLSFSVSLAFFDHAHIYASTPLVYPPLVYLLVRMLLLARVGRRGPSRREAPKAPRLLISPAWLAIGVVFLLGFRIALNVTDSNVIDVGYAGVIGAQRIAHDKPLYGGFPSDNEHGDTYGPVNYEIYLPFQQVFGWSGTWDDLPAAHAAAIFFDLLAVVLLFLLGRRIRGPGLGILLAYAWVSYPFTLYALESNSNDSLVAALILAALLACPRRWGQAATSSARGMFSALAGLTKFAPLALAPLLWTHGLGGLSLRRRAGALALYAFAFVLTAAVVSIPAFTHDSLHTIYERTLAYQSDRESPFSIWGLYGSSPTGGHYLRWLNEARDAVVGAGIMLALALAVLPRREDLVGLAAAAAAILIAVQLGIDHWFYLYIPWFFGLVMLALLGQINWDGPSPPPGLEQADAASGSARSSLLAAAASSV
ncbi:MAG TPA: hypothetical protein VHY18_04865 [Solirubrobacteraceae bacterium]|jgi:hypothetical protein|nr:hypothetical protein [Solirubrobacteraceae bacterium]